MPDEFIWCIRVIESVYMFILYLEYVCLNAVQLNWNLKIGVYEYITYKIRSPLVEDRYLSLMLVLVSQGQGKNTAIMYSSYISCCNSKKQHVSISSNSISCIRLLAFHENSLISHLLISSRCCNTGSFDLLNMIYFLKL